MKKLIGIACLLTALSIGSGPAAGAFCFAG